MKTWFRWVKTHPWKAFRAFVLGVYADICPYGLLWGLLIAFAVILLCVWGDDVIERTEAERQRRERGTEL